MSRETRLLRGSIPLLAIGLIFGEGMAPAVRVSGFSALLLLAVGVWLLPLIVRAWARRAEQNTRARLAAAAVASERRAVGGARQAADGRAVREAKQLP